MAKSRSILNFQGTLDGKTFVHSRAYGKYVRAARGTYKHADVNDAFKQESIRLLNANVPAKIIKDAIDPYRKHFKGGQLWQRLVSVFRKQLHQYGIVDFCLLPEIEVHEDYPMSRLLHISVEVTSCTENLLLPVRLVCSQAPNFRNPAVLDGYRIGVIGIFPHVELKTADTTVAYAPVMKLNEEPGVLTLNLPVPERATNYVLCVVVEGFESGRPDKSPAKTGMRILKGGKIQ
jgi:hypothetical protein